MIEVTTIPVMFRRGSRRYMATHQGAILNGLLITWRCGHVHETRLEAQQCANHEAHRRGIPLVSALNGHEIGVPD